MSVGKNIRRIRRAKDITQDALAKRVNVTQSMIAQIERDSKIPTVLLTRDIAEALDCTIDDILAS